MSSKFERMSNNSKPQSTRYFAAWEVDRTPPNCVPRWVSVIRSWPREKPADKFVRRKSRSRFAKYFSSAAPTQTWTRKVSEMEMCEWFQLRLVHWTSSMSIHEAASDVAGAIFAPFYSHRQKWPISRFDLIIASHATKEANDDSSTYIFNRTPESRFSDTSLTRNVWRAIRAKVREWDSMILGPIKNALCLNLSWIDQTKRTGSFLLAANICALGWITSVN